MFVTVLAALSCQPSLSAYWLGAKAGGGLLILSGAQCVAFKGICELICFFFFWMALEGGCISVKRRTIQVVSSCFLIFLNERWG